MATTRAIPLQPCCPTVTYWLKAIPGLPTCLTARILRPDRRRFGMSDGTAYRPGVGLRRNNSGLQSDRNLSDVVAAGDYELSIHRNSGLDLPDLRYPVQWTVASGRALETSTRRLRIIRWCGSPITAQITCSTREPTATARWGRHWIGDCVNELRRAGVHGNGREYAGGCGQRHSFGGR